MKIKVTLILIGLLFNINNSYSQNSSIIIDSLNITVDNIPGSDTSKYLHIHFNVSDPSNTDSIFFFMGSDNVNDKFMTRAKIVYQNGQYLFQENPYGTYRFLYSNFIPSLLFGIHSENGIDKNFYNRFKGANKYFKVYLKDKNGLYSKEAIYYFLQ